MLKKKTINAMQLIHQFPFLMNILIPKDVFKLLSKRLQ